MRNIVLAISALVAVASAAPALAVTMSYTVDGVFEDGASLSGGFDVDFEGGPYVWDQVQNITLSINGVKSYEPVRSWGYTEPYSGADYVSLAFEGPRYYLFLGFLAYHDSARLLSFESQALAENTVYVNYDDDYSTKFIASGSITAVAPGVVPEPSTWGMMLAGLGLTGAALRSRRRSVTFSAA